MDKSFPFTASSGPCSPGRLDRTQLWDDIVASDHVENHITSARARLESDASPSREGVSTLRNEVGRIRLIWVIQVWLI